MIEEAVEIETTITIIVVTTETEITEITETTGIIEINGINGEFTSQSINERQSFSFLIFVNRSLCYRGDRNRGDNYNRGGGNRNEIRRDDKEKPPRRDKSGEARDIDRMPKYQAPVKPVSKTEIR